jgi:two-component system response regulator HydG
MTANNEARLVLVDDDISMCEFLADSLSSKGFEVSWCTEPEKALSVIEREDCDAVITDMQLGSSTGLDLCGAIVARRPELPVIVITAFGSMDAAIAAMRVGAYDFLNKPVDMRMLELAIFRAVNHRRLEREVHQLRESAREVSMPSSFVGDCEPMRRMYELIERLRDSDASVLISGDSGSGKELVARALHAKSLHYGEGAFVPINCAAVTATLLESVLFGHVKGAFTDAKDSRDGLFIRANGGTLFLDEIGEMPMEMQSKLLRVLQERRVRPVGGADEIAFDCRIVASTNRRLEDEVAAGRFREDLYYRINVVTIDVPPLCDRGNDILSIAQHFLLEAAARSNKAVRGMSGDVARMLLGYTWPGNVRELKNAMDRAVALTRREDIAVDDLPPSILRFSPVSIAQPNELDLEAMISMEELERRYIRQVLRAADGNKTQAARVLGIDRRTLYRKLERLDAESAAQS